MYLISLYFDDGTNRILQRHIKRVAEKSGNTFMTDNNVPPHMTVAALEARSAAELIPAFTSLEGMVTGGEVNFVTVGQLFPYVIYASPVLNEYLQEMSEKVHSCFKDLEGVSESRYYLPGSWLPHVTIGKTLERQQMRLAFESLQENFAPFSGMVTAIGLASVNPHTDVSRIEL